MIATTKPGGEFANKINSRCQITNLNSGKPIRAIIALSKCIDNFKPDAVICFGFSPGIAASLSKFLFRWRPSLIIRAENDLKVEWSSSRLWNQIIGPRLSRWAARKAHTVAVSRALAGATSTYLGMPASRITAILNPVIDNISKQPDTSASNLHPWLTNKSIPTFVAVGRLDHRKGFDILIDAFSRMRQKAGARLIIFGEGSLRNNLQRKIKSNGMADHIDLAGMTSDPLLQMTASHAFVLSSRSEGFGLVLVEAMLAGTKLISTNCDFGPAELLENGRYGKLVPVDDAQALADAMLQSIQEPWTAERPDEKWFAQFTATEAARQHLALIEKLRSDSGDLD